MRWWVTGGLGVFAIAGGCGRSDLSPDIGGAGGSGSVVHSAFGETMIALGDEHTCVRRVYGDVLCFGHNAEGQLGVQGETASPTAVAVKLPALAKAVYAGAFHTCAVLVDDTVYCWGANASGQVGVAASVNEPTPVKVLLPSGTISKMSLGESHTCLLQRDATSDSTLYCWGANDAGQAGVGIMSPSVPPTKIAKSVYDIGLGNTHTDGVFKIYKTDGESALLLGGFGNDALLELGFAGQQVDAPQTSTVLGIANVASGRSEHGCGLYDGTPMQAGDPMGTPGLFCWGSNTNGELGRGTLSSDELPGAVVGLAAAPNAFTVGSSYSCAAVMGKVSCWGLNDAGQFGNGMVTMGAPAPAAGPNFATVRSLAGGKKHVCAIVTNSDVECWGSNAFGQLGDGSTTDRFSPVQMVLPP